MFSEISTELMEASGFCAFGGCLESSHLRLNLLGMSGFVSYYCVRWADHMRTTPFTIINNQAVLSWARVTPDYEEGITRKTVFRNSPVFLPFEALNNVSLASMIWIWERKSSNSSASVSVTCVKTQSRVLWWLRTCRRWDMSTFMGDCCHVFITSIVVQHMLNSTSLHW